MRVRRIHKLSIFILVIIFTNAGGAPKNYHLKYKPNEKALKYKTKTNVLTLQEMMGSEMESESKFEGVTSVTMAAANDENLVVTLENESLKIHIFSPQFDSTLVNPEGLVKKKIKKTIAPNGDQLASVEIDSFLVPQFMPGFTTEQEFLANLPTEPLSIGQTVHVADEDTTHTFGGENISRQNMKYTLLSEEEMKGRKCLKLDVIGDFTLEGKGNFRGREFFIEGDGTTEGTMYFDSEAGIVVNWSNKTEVEMTIAVTGQQNMTIPTTQTMENSGELMD